MYPGRLATQGETHITLGREVNKKELQTVSINGPYAIYNWEGGTSRPRAQQLAALVAVRGLALRRLELLQG